MGFEKEYINKVLRNIVRGTMFDFDKKTIRFPFLHHTFLIEYFFSKNVNPSTYLIGPFFGYCKNQFGLTNGEIEYIWEKYMSIIYNTIIENGE